LVATRGKRTQLLLLPASLMARFLEAARSTTKGCKKDMERGLIPFLSLHEMNVKICGLRKNKKTKDPSYPGLIKKRKYVKHDSTLISDCKCGALGVRTMLKTIRIYHSLPCQNC